MVYEQWGLSSLERIVGKEASSVCFVANYVQVYFDQIVLTCYTLPVVHVSDQPVTSQMPGYKDRLYEFVGKTVESVTEKPREDLAI
jgi:hypothetical protein